MTKLLNSIAHRKRREAINYNKMMTAIEVKHRTLDLAERTRTAHPYVLQKANMYYKQLKLEK